MSEEEIFHQALARSPRERAAFLEQACTGDGALRAAVEALLRAHVGASGFLEEPAAALGAVVTEQWVSEGPGAIIGAYKLLEQIGEGGFGLVFMAEQQQPVRRKVAIKVLKPGMDTRQVIARFEAERQALALMDHPNIARVLEAGETDAGRPYFAMELVRGVPITDYCDKAHLMPRQRLELFLTVCQAVQHAHQKAIIHRDIKPSNVLVTLHDGTPVVKVIDFGIAKALGQQLTDKTLFTGFAQLVGTPLYMSPEQAEMSGLDVDTRSDIYSLGVLLYELLTGTTPFDKERLSQAGYDEMRRIIREEEPLRPSTRISTMGQAATPVSARRQSDPKQLSRLFRGELDWIVMKALEKERSRRYESAGGLARDVERYLGGEVVTACPPSAWYRFRKLAGRHKTGLVAAACIALALVAGTAISVWQAIRATDAADSERQALLDLGEEQKATRRELGRAQEAEVKATRELFDSLVAQARANRLSRRSGQRFRTLELIRKGTAIAHQLKLPQERFLQMRNEAIAALALPDLVVAREWPTTEGHTHFDAKFERYARADHKGNVEVRRAGDGKLIHRLASVGPGENWSLLSPDGGHLSVFENDRDKLHVWKLTGAEPTRVLPPVSVLGAHWFSPDSRRLALQEKDGAVSVFDLATSTRVRRLPKLTRINRLAWHPSGGRLALAGYDFAQVRDLETGKVIWQKTFAPDYYRWLDWRPDGKVLAVGDAGADTISLWDVEQDKQIGRLEEFQESGLIFSFNLTGTVLATYGWSGILRLWDVDSGRQLFNTYTGMRNYVQFSADGRFLAASRHGKKLRIWEIAAADEYRTLVASPLKGKNPYHGLAISPKARFLAASGSGGVALWDLPSGKELAFLEGWYYYVAFERCTPPKDSGQEQVETLLTMGANGLLRWPVRTDQEKGVVSVEPAEKLPLPAANAVIAQSLDGRVLAFSQIPLPRALVRHADQLGQLIALEPHHDVRHVAVSPDGRWIATGRHSPPSGIKIWELKQNDKPSAKGLTYTLVKDLAEGCQGSLFSPDGKHLLTFAYTESRPVRRWDVATWLEVPFQEPMEGQICAFSPDGKLLVQETGLGVTHLLNAGTGREYARLEDPDQHRAANYAFTPDGARLACTTTHDGNCVHVWDLRAIRRQLAEMDLDWELPPYPPVAERPASAPLRVEVLGGPPDPKALTKNNEAWKLATAAEEKSPNPKRAVELAKQAVALAPKEGNFWNTLGVAHYRAGQWQESITALEKAMQLQAGEFEAFHTFFLAMAHWQRNEPEQARKYYAQAMTWLEKHQAALGKVHAEELGRFRAEAAALLEGKVKK